MFLDAPALTLWGPFIWLLIPFQFLAFMFVPDIMPDIDTTSGKKADALSNLWIQIANTSVHLFEPYLYVFLYFVTFNAVVQIRDLQLFNLVDNGLLFLYINEFLFLPIAWIQAIGLTFLFFPIYMII